MRDDNKQAHRRVTVTLQDELILRARELVGTQPTSELIRQALVALIERESARRLALLTSVAQEQRSPSCAASDVDESVCHKIAHLAAEQERHINEATLQQLVTDLYRAVAEARSVVREAIADVRATLEALQKSRPHGSAPAGSGFAGG